VLKKITTIGSYAEEIGRDRRVNTLARGSNFPSVGPTGICGIWYVQWRDTLDMTDDQHKSKGQAGTMEIDKNTTPDVHDLSQRLLGKQFDSLSAREKNVLHHVVHRQHISRNVQKEHEDRLTFGQRLADRVAAFGGSWPFIILFGLVMVSWVVLNSYLLARWKGQAFDPYPYILLNLVLSMLAAIQAPVIMMSQNRQSVKDRIDAAHDYEVNLKAELEIMSLHRKMDGLREQQWDKLLGMQQDQIQMLKHLLEEVQASNREGK
jgi:uncharacterized membrane protein